MKPKSIPWLLHLLLLLAIVGAGTLLMYGMGATNVGFMMMLCYYLLFPLATILVSVRVGKKCGTSPLFALAFGVGYVLLRAIHPYTSVFVDLEYAVFYGLLAWVVTAFAQPVKS